MQQEKNDTETNFLQIENDAEANLSQMGSHWEQMKHTLALQTPKNLMPKKWAWISFPIICIVGLFLFFTNKNSKNNATVNADTKLAKEIINKIIDTANHQNEKDTTNQNKTLKTTTQKVTSSNLLISKKSSKIFNSLSNSKNKVTKEIIASYDIPKTEVITIKDSTKIDITLGHAQKMEMLNNFISSIQKKGELFKINNLKDTTIKAAEGTVFYIPMNSFNTIDSVVFEVKEYYKYSDMVASGLTTMADDKQLISGGMLSLTATVKGKEIAINPAKEIRVFIPNLTAKDSMKIFEGKKKETQDFNLQKSSVLTQNNINWQLSKVRIDSAVLKMFIRAIDLKDDLIEYGTSFNNKTKAIFPRATKSSYSKSELLIMLRKKYGDYYDKIRVHNQWKRNLFFQNTEVDEEEYYRLAYNSWGVGDTAEFLPSTMRIYKLVPIDTVYKAWKWITKGYVTANRPTFSQNTLSLIGEKYSIGINKLGWINCDKFYNYSGRKSSFTVDLKDSAYYYVTYLIFEKYKSIMQGSESGKMVVFPDIPMGEPVKIISIGIKDGKTIACMKNTITSANIINDLPFEKTSSKDFKASLTDLDNKKD